MEGLEAGKKKNNLGTTSSWSNFEILNQAFFLRINNFLPRDAPKGFGGKATLTIADEDAAGLAEQK